MKKCTMSRWLPRVAALALIFAVPTRASDSGQKIAVADAARRTAARVTAGRDIRDILGCTHVSGKYHFSKSKDFLNEGADELLAMNMNVIKLWFNERPAINYPYNANWPEKIETLVDLAKTDYYRAVFEKPFKHYILVAFAFGMTGAWQDGAFSQAEYDEVHRQFYDLTSYLLKTYKGSGKTFVLQNWEGDNVLKVWSNPERIPSFKTMIAWQNCRQDGVQKARTDVGMDGVRVVHALEVNRISTPSREFDHPLVVDEVVPLTRCDLYSFSSWGTRMPGDEHTLTAKLDHLAKQAPDSKLYGARNIMLGEFGAYERSYKPKANNYPQYVGDTGGAQFYANMKQLNLALEWGVEYAVYWQLYCNGLIDKKNWKTGKVATADMLKGGWLIRPDGSRTPTYDYFLKLLAPTDRDHEAGSVEKGENNMSKLITRLAKGKKTRIVLYGTSLTAGNLWGSVLQSWLDAEYPGMATVINSGEGGKDSIWGIKNLGPRVLDKAPDVVFIEFAINDAGIYKDGTVKLPVDGARTNLIQMIDSIQARNPDVEIILQTMNGAWNSPSGSGISGTIRPNLAAYYQMVRDVADERGLMLIDHYPNWMALKENDPDTYRRYVKDGVHPIQEGINAVMIPLLKRKLTGRHPQP